MAMEMIGTSTDEQLSPEAEEFFAEIEGSGALPSGLDARKAASGVLCTLSLRLTRGEYRDFAASLPHGIQRLLLPCEPHKDQPGQLFDREEFLRKVAHHCRIREDEAEPVARAVLHAARTRIREGEQLGVGGQLPKELKELWMNA